MPLETFLWVAEKVARAWAIFVPTLPSAKAAADFTLYLTEEVSVPLLMPWVTQITRTTTEHVVLATTDSPLVAIISSEFASQWVFQHWSRLLWGTYLSLFLLSIWIFSNYLEPFLWQFYEERVAKSLL